MRTRPTSMFCWTRSDLRVFLHGKSCASCSTKQGKQRGRSFPVVFAMNVVFDNRRVMPVDDAFMGLFDQRSHGSFKRRVVNLCSHNILLGDGIRVFMNTWKCLEPGISKHQCRLALSDSFPPNCPGDCRHKF